MSILYSAFTQCSYSICLKTDEENVKAIDDFADKWRAQVTRFSCFYDTEDVRKVISHKQYSKADVIHSMVWPALTILTCGLIFLYLEARRRRKASSNDVTNGDKTTVVVVSNTDGYNQSPHSQLPPPHRRGNESADTSPNQRLLHVSNAGRSTPRSSPLLRGSPKGQTNDISSNSLSSLEQGKQKDSKSPNKHRKQRSDQSDVSNGELHPVVSDSQQIQC